MYLLKQNKKNYIGKWEYEDDKERIRIILHKPGFGIEKLPNIFMQTGNVIVLKRDILNSIPQEWLKDTNMYKVNVLNKENKLIDDVKYVQLVVSSVKDFAEFKTVKDIAKVEKHASMVMFDKVVNVDLFSDFIFVSERLFNLFQPLLNNKYVIYFNEGLVDYASLALNALRYGVTDKFKYVRSEHLNLFASQGKSASKAYLNGSNIEFIVIDQGADMPGILWSANENIPYETWDRGDDSRRIPLLFKKPEEVITKIK